MPRGGYRPGSGPAKGTKYKTKTETIKSEASALSEKKYLPMENLTPLEYMQRVMNDPSNDTSIRLRAASLAAPFVHSRKGEGGGKKDEREAKAKTAGSGKFAASPPPLRAVK